MPQIVLDLDDKDLERKLMDEARQNGRRLSDVILDALRRVFLPKIEFPLKYQTLDPLKSMSKIEYTPDNDSDLDEKALDNVFPFADVEDSAVFVRKIRKNDWRS